MMGSREDSLNQLSTQFSKIESVTAVSCVCVGGLNLGYNLRKYAEI